MLLQPHTIKPARGSRRAIKRVGRGNASGHGTSSTRGGKGQTARSGGQRGLLLKAFKPLLQSTPKLRGFTSMAVRPTEVLLAHLEKHFTDGETVTVAGLKQKGLIGKSARTAKILNSGKLTKKLTISGVAVTKGASAAIAAAGGEVK